MYKHEIVQKLKTLKPTIWNKYHISSLELFGSSARNEAQEQSDIDLLVEFSDTPDLLTFIELEDSLQKSLGQKIDLVPKRKLKPELKEIIEREAILI